MKKIISIAVAFIIAALIPLAGFSDGTVTAPVSNPATSWKIQSVVITTGVGTDTPAIVIAVQYFDAALAVSRTDSITVTASADILSFFAQVNVPATGESGTAAKKFRQRVTKWLADNGKITNVTPE